MHIDPAGVQLLFVDLQTFLTSANATEKADMIGKAAGALARTATSLGVPITFSLVPGADTTPQPVPELQEFATADNVFTRQSASAFLIPRLATCYQAIAARRSLSPAFRRRSLYCTPDSTRSRRDIRSMWSSMRSAAIPTAPSRRHLISSNAPV